MRMRALLFLAGLLFPLAAVAQPLNYAGSAGGSLIPGANITCSSGATCTPGSTIASTGGTAAAGGSNTQIQRNNGGAVDGTSGETCSATQCTLVAPILGTVTSANLAAATGYTIANIAGLGTGVGTALGVNVGSAGAPVVNGGALGTPASGVGTNLTGTAAGLTAGNVTTNANLTGPITSTGNATAVGAQTGTGSTFVMQASPTLTTPVLGTVAAGSVLTNATGLPVATGVSGLGSGVATALGVAKDTTGGVCTVGGSGCPGGGSGTVTTLTAGTNVTFSSGATCTTTCTINASGSGSPLTVTDGTNTVTSTTTITTGAGLVVGGSAGSATVNNTQLINPQTGTTYMLLNTDVGVLVTLNNGSAIALTVPQAGTTGFENGKSFPLANIGAGLVTATTSGSTFKGAGGGVSFTLPQNTQCWLNSDGSNWIVDGCTAYLSGTAIKTGTVPVANGGTGINSFGTGVATALGVNVGSAGALVTNGGALGTPSSGTLTSATGLPISTGVSGLGTSVATALAVNVGSAGALVTNGGALGTPSSGVGTNLTGVPVATGVSGLGSGVATALAITHDASGGVCTVGGGGCASGGTGSGTFNYSDNGLTLTAGTYYAPIGGGGANSTTEANVSLKASSTFTVVNLQVQLSADPGAGQTVVITLRKVGADTALKCTITGGSGAVCQDLNAGDSVSVAQNDLIDWKIVTTGTVVGTFNVNIMANSGATPGGVTSVAMTVPSRQTVSGSPITASGTLAITDNNQNANLIFAGPASGSAAGPTFRSLANADVPFVSTVNSYVTGSYYPLFASEGTQNYNCNSVTTICWTTYIADQSFTISEIGGLITTLSGGGNFQLAVYNINAGNTAASGAALCSTASISTATTGPFTSACAASFVKNTTYLIGVIFDNTVAKLSAPGSATLANSMRLGNPTLANIASGTTWGTIVTTTGQTFGTWPTSPALTFAQNNTPRTVLPIIKINTIP